LHPGQFGIYFPDDVHAPMIGEGRIRKLIMKVKVD
jgi:beta-galactosidase beta subunit